MKKAVLFTLLAILTIAIVLTVVFLSNPLGRSTDDIEEAILALTPIGTDMDEVLRVIESHEKWELRQIDDNNDREQTNLSRDFIKGKRSIKAEIGKYRNFSELHIVVYWGFDENSKLIEVGVRKD